MATKRIKGALELLGWVLLFSFFVMGYNLYSYLTMLFDPGLKEYPGWFVTVVWAESLYFAMLFLLIGYSLYLYWNEMVRFKLTVLTILAVSIIFHLILTIYIDVNTDIKEIINTSARYLYGSIGAGIIWMPYILFSKRVKGTFTDVPNSPRYYKTATVMRKGEEAVSKDSKKKPPVPGSIGFKEIYLSIEHAFVSFTAFCAGIIFSKKFAVSLFLCSSFIVLIVALRGDLMMSESMLYLLLFAVISTSLWTLDRYSVMLQGWVEKTSKWLLRLGVPAIFASLLFLLSHHVFSFEEISEGNPFRNIEQKQQGNPFRNIQQK